MSSETVLPRSTPEAQGISSTAILNFVDAVEASGIEMHGFMLARHGNIVAEGWWKPYSPDRRHMLFSLSKSFTAAAAGIAVEEGLITLDDKVVSFFPNDLPANVSENLAAMRIRDLLSMSTGHAEDSLPYLFRNDNQNWAQGFLARDVEFQPGTHFVYNSGATYMVAAILSKVTKTTLMEYLTPRLLEPLGIEGAWWETCPLGVNVGGWGLNIRTEDVVRFGQLYLNKGVWNGRRLLTEAWIEQASSKQIANGDDPNNDWNQGYGFQFWLCRHNCYRGDGAFGQFCVIMPEVDAVFAANSGTGDMQGILNHLFTHLLPSMSTPHAADVDAQTRLTERLSSLTLPLVSGQAKSPAANELSGKIYQFEPNEEGWTSIAFDFADGKTETTITKAKGAPYSLVSAGSDWYETITRLTVGTYPFASDGRENGEYPCAVTAAWTDPATYTVKVCGKELPFSVTFTAKFEGDRITLNRRTNVAFGPTDRPQLVGKAI